MSQGIVMKIAPGAVLAAALGVSVPSFAQEPSPLFELSRRPTSTMSNPYRLIENWPTLRPGMEWGAAIGLIPDGTGGTWMMFRSEPPINYINAEGQITKSFGDGMIVQAHGFCMDGDGNLWAGDSGPFGDDPSTAGRGFQLHKFSQDGELLMSLGQAGVSAAGEDTFIGPTACAVAPNGNIIVADGHWPRPSTAQQDGDRMVEIPGPPVAPEGGGRSPRNPGWQVGVRIGSAKDGSLDHFIPGTRPEGMAADEAGNIFAGLTSGCDASPSGGCLQKWVPR